MAEIPNLAGIATENLVDKIGGGNFQASYINWARTLHLLRTHAPGWLPELVQATDGGVVHTAPVGAFLMIRFRHEDGTVTPEVPQAVMDNSNRAIPLERVTARDVTDTHVRGVCKAAAVTFGLAYELWAKIKLESGYAEEEQQPEKVTKINPMDGVAEGIDPDRMEEINNVIANMREHLDMDDPLGAFTYWRERAPLKDNAEKAVAWKACASYEQNAMKKAGDGDIEGAVSHLIRNRKRAA